MCVCVCVFISFLLKHIRAFAYILPKGVHFIGFSNGDKKNANFIALSRVTFIFVFSQYSIYAPADIPSSSLNNKISQSVYD